MVLLKTAKTVIIWPSKPFPVYGIWLKLIHSTNNSDISVQYSLNEDISRSQNYYYIAIATHSYWMK